MNKIVYFLMRYFRKKVNAKKMCDECFSDYIHQTKCGKMLCGRCNKRYLLGKK